MKSLSALYSSPGFPARGVFIAIEGPDGSGKTTLAHGLSKFFDAHETFEPTQGSIGRILRDSLSGATPLLSSKAEALLFAADRQEHIEKTIKPILLRGEHVITDRYVVSSLVYQGAKLGDAWVYAINKFAVIPDVTIVLSAPPEVAWERIVQRNKETARSLDHYESYEQIVANTLRYQSLILYLRDEWRSASYIIPINIGDSSPDAVLATAIAQMSSIYCPIEKIVKSLKREVSYRG